ncbi:hypothetical protein AB0O47_40100 [Streptomyces noursei]|uniref:hypothetical protein n=1 Tax=Streptomyces noursei TaxID=1971 RepID=UPI003450C9D9
MPEQTNVLPDATLNNIHTATLLTDDIVITALSLVARHIRSRPDTETLREHTLMTIAATAYDDASKLLRTMKKSPTGANYDHHSHYVLTTIAIADSLTLRAGHGPTYQIAELLSHLVTLAPADADAIRALATHADLQPTAGATA